jgi:hypothetical protein
MVNSAGKGASAAILICGAGDAIVVQFRGDAEFADG